VYRRRNVYFIKVTQRRFNSTINIVRNKNLFKGIPGVAERSDARGKNALKDIPGYNIRS